MDHKLSGKAPKKINFEKGVFESNGTFYYVNPEAIGYERLKRYAELLPVVTYGRKYTQFAEMIHNLRMKMLTSEDPLKKVYFDVVTELTNWDQYLLDSSGKFYDNCIDDTLRFCALFIVTKDEDLTKVDDILMEKKISDFKSDIDIRDLFFFAKKLIPNYKDLLQTLFEEAKTKGGSLKEITIPEN